MGEHTYRTVSVHIMISRAERDALSLAYGSPRVGLRAALDALHLPIEDDEAEPEAPEEEVPLWGVSQKHIWRAGDRVESVLGRTGVEVIRPGTVVEISESLFRHEHLIVKFDDGEQRAVNPDVMRHHKFKRNTPGAIDDVPACEDYCARCGRHRSEH